MIITKSNVLGGVSPTITRGKNTSFSESSITDSDFSTLYTSSDNQYLTMGFGVVPSISYVAVAGLNIAGNKDFTSRVSVMDGDTVLIRNFISNNNCVVIDFEERSFSNLRVVLYNDAGNTPPSVRHIAAGKRIQVPNSGETSGHNRQFLNRNEKNRSTVNNLGAPIAQLKKKVAAKGSLNLPNMTKEFSEGEWQEFLDFSMSNHFFIREQDNSPNGLGGRQSYYNNSAYMCFDVQNNSVTAHGETRALNNIKVSFKVFNGL